MRTLVILLLLANLSLFAYTRLDSTGGGEGKRLTEQVQPDKIRILTPQQVVALGPAKAAALADVCLEWGPFSDADRVRALADVEPLALGKLLAQRRVEISGAYWVYLPPFANKAAADRRAAELRAAGTRDPVVVDGGPQRFAISLGVFRTEDAANAYLSSLSREGISGARAGLRQQAIVQTLLVIRDPQLVAVAKLRDLAAAYPGAEMKIGTCEKAA
jgi:sporulation related protein